MAPYETSAADHQEALISQVHEAPLLLPCRCGSAAFNVAWVLTYHPRTLTVWGRLKQKEGWSRTMTLAPEFGLAQFSNGGVNRMAPLIPTRRNGLLAL